MLLSQQQANQDGHSTEQDRFEAAAAAAPEVIGPEQSPAEAPPLAGEPLEHGWPRGIVEGIFTLPTSYVAARLGDYWLLTPEEKSLLVDACKPVLDELIPWEALGKFGGVLLVLAMVFGPRLAEMQLRDQKARVERAKQAGSGSAAETPSTATAEFAV